MRKVTKKSAAKDSSSPKNNNKKKDEVESPADPADTKAGGDDVVDRQATGGSEDQIQTVSTFDVLNAGDTSADGFNPKYQGRLKASTGMFPTYHPTYEEKKVQRTMRKQVCNQSPHPVKTSNG